MYHLKNEQMEVIEIKITIDKGIFDGRKKTFYRANFIFPMKDDQEYPKNDISLILDTRKDLLTTIERKLDKIIKKEQ